MLTCSQTTRSLFRRILVRLNEAECTQKSPLLCGAGGFFVDTL